MRSTTVLFLRELPVGLGHDLDKVFESHLRFPAEDALGLGGIAEELLDFGGAEVIGRDLDEDASARFTDPFFINAFPFEAQPDPHGVKGVLAELADGVHLAGGADVIVGGVLLKDAPHHLGVFGGVTPVTLGVEIAEDEVLLGALGDASGGTGDLAGHEGLAPAGGLVIEKDAVRGMDAVGLPVVHHDPEAVELGDAVGRARVEWSRFGLRHFLNESVELAGRGLVKTRLLFESDFLEGVEETERSDRVDFGGVFGNFEGDLHVALRAEVVDLAGADALEETVEVRRVGEVTVMEVKALFLAEFLVVVEVVDPIRVEGTATADHSVNLVAFLKELFGEVGTVLSGDAGDECFFHWGKCLVLSA
jgi:hypothetical protein